MGRDRFSSSLETPAIPESGLIHYLLSSWLPRLRVESEQIQIQGST
jgi:hypothetical protein